MNIKGKKTISICNIVKNEEKQIKGFISHIIDFADEIIIIDTGSSDGTLDIINKFIKDNPHKIKLYKYFDKEIFHYGKAKNFSMEKATKDFIIILDADERLSNNFKKNVRDFLLKKNPKVVKIKRVDDYVKHLIDYPERIIRNGNNIFYSTDEKGMVHENLNHKYESIEFDATVWHCQRWNHYIHRPQRIFFQLELQVERVPKTKTFFGHFLRGLWYFKYRFKKLYFKRKLYRDGKRGFKYSFMRSLDAFLIEFFVGLKPAEGHKYWNDKKYDN